MKRPTFPGIEEVRQLPTSLNMTVPPEWEDRNGHVNMQHYLTLYELGGYEILEGVDFGDAYLKVNNFGLFDLEHHIHFRAEMHIGDQVSTYNRIVALNPKRFQGVYFVLNDTREQLACAIEYVTAGVYLGNRRTSPFPNDLYAGLQKILARHEQLAWSAPLCGAMSI